MIKTFLSHFKQKKLLLALTLVIFGLSFANLKVWGGAIGDTTGRIGSVQINVTNIDKIAPVIAGFNTSPAARAADGVFLTIIATDAGGSNITGYSFDNGATRQSGNTKLYIINTGGTALVRDAAGNISSGAVFSVNNIDKTAPNYTSITHSPDGDTNQDVTVTINGANDTGAGLATEAYSFDGGATRQAENYKVYEDNQPSLTIKIRDAVGNITEEPYGFSNIDKDELLLDIAHYPAPAHSGAITVMITTNKTGGTAPAGWTQEDATTYSQVFNVDDGTAQTLTGTVQIENYVGTTNTIDYSLMIDKEVPTCDINYSTTGSTNGNVIAALINCNETVILSGGTQSSEQTIFTYTFTGNGSYIFEYSDLLGNTGSTQATVNWIDRESPYATSIIYTPNNTFTTGNVIVQITINKPILRPDGRSGASTGLNFTKSFEHNFSGYVILTDLIGNTGTVNIIISRTADDTDGDGVPDFIENQDNTDPDNPNSFKDTDGDEVPDYVETEVDNTDPNNNATDQTCQISCSPANSYKDSDGDGVPDYVEIKDGTDPSDPDDFRDDNNNGIPDYVERHAKPPQIIDEQKVIVGGGDVIVQIEISKPVDNIDGREKLDNTHFQKKYEENTPPEGDIVILQDFDGNEPVEEIIHVTEVHHPTIPPTDGGGGSVPEWVTGGGGGGGGNNLNKDNCPNDSDFSPSYYDGTCGIDISPDREHSAANIDNPLAKGIQYFMAYRWAKNLGITDKPTYADARMNYTITRADMAKMIVVFLETHTGYVMQMSNAPECSTFADLDGIDTSRQKYVAKACQMGLMGIKGTGYLQNFRPKDTISKAEVGTIISRILWKEKYYQSGSLYYQKHLNALLEAMIIEDVSRPTIPELRGNVMLMLMKVELFL
ncbi:hypothetical protein AGMMS50249_7170 [candidate division SR1 bacterium]|nr:hypothetical protein AGMMS50249_7170 [candidate division SR1 bacterium]